MRSHGFKYIGGNKVIKVVGVRFKKAGKIYYFDPMDLKINQDEKVIVETARGMEFGIAVVLEKKVRDDEIVSPLKPILRIATEEDISQSAENKILAHEAYKLCEEKVKEHNLDMFLVDAEYTFDRNKLIFYFTAEGRVDFRDLVKDLAAVFRTRIELRQIGVRDEAKSIGGLGCCGKPLCCSTWLGEFQPVSIKMAKDQGLSLNPTKISGVCGRLFCCLKYEHETYEAVLEDMPEVSSIIQTPDGVGKVIDTNVLMEEVKVLMDNKDTVDIRKYKTHEIKVLKKPKRSQDTELKALEKELKKLED